MIIIFIIHNTVKHFGFYLGCTALFLLSNITHCIIECVWSNMAVSELKTMQISGGGDMFAYVMVPVVVYIYEMIVIAVTVIVFIECTVSIIMRSCKHKKTKQHI